jgi:glycosyltransferase involved in cell wall biosynthesis
MGIPDSLSILYVGSLPPARHGVAVVCGQLLAGLAAAGHHVRAISPIEGDAGGENHRSAAAPPGVDVTWMSMPEVPSDHARAPDAYRQELGARFQRMVDAQVATGRPDILLIGNTSMAEHLPALVRAHGLTSIVMLHGITTAGMLDGSLPRPLRQRLLTGFQQADSLIAIAPHVAESVRPLGFDSVPVIENPVDVRRFAPRPRDHDLTERLGIGRDDLVMAHASKLEPVKRPLDIVLAAERTLQVAPRLLYLILGDGSLRAPMEEACAQRGIAPRFRFTGWLDHSAVPAYLNLAEVVVMPSELEGRSLVYLETWASGRVLLASDIPSARELITDGETGLLFRLGDVAHLAARMLEVATDAGLRERIGRRARQAAESFGLDNVVGAYTTLFRKVIARRRR